MTALTEREREVARLIADGLPNKRIAFVLGISRNTVKKHVEHILDKINGESRAQIAAFTVSSSRPWSGH